VHRIRRHGSGAWKRNRFLRLHLFPVSRIFVRSPCIIRFYHSSSSTRSEFFKDIPPRLLAHSLHAYLRFRKSPSVKLALRPRDGGGNCSGEASAVPRYLPAWRSASPSVVPLAISPNGRCIPCGSAVIFASRRRAESRPLLRRAITDYSESFAPEIAQPVSLR